MTRLSGEIEDVMPMVFVLDALRVSEILRDLVLAGRV